jgi:hypothetical protein
MPRFEKGSQEAKDFMMALRAKRGMKKGDEENIKLDISEVPVKKGRGIPRKYDTPEEAKKAKSENTMKARKAKLEQGKGITDLAKKTIGVVKDTVSAVIYGRKDFPPNVRSILDEYGDKIITGITLGRTPLGKPMMSALQIASGNTFAQKLSNTPYDKLFHLFICLDFSGKKVMLEKNEVINAKIGCRLPKDTETRVITSSDIPSGLTLSGALKKTQDRMKGKFFPYSAYDNNCMDFIAEFLRANNLGSEADISWVKQETKVLFEGNERLRKIVNTITDIGARVDVLKQGAGIVEELRKREIGQPNKVSQYAGERSERILMDREDVNIAPPPPPPPPTYLNSPRPTGRRRMRGLT